MTVILADDVFFYIMKKNIKQMEASRESLIFTSEILPLCCVVSFFPFFVAWCYIIITTLYNVTSILIQNRRESYLWTSGGGEGGREGGREGGGEVGEGRHVCCH